MGRWKRRAVTTTGVAAGGALAVGVAIRPANRVPKLAGSVAANDEVLISSWVKIDQTMRGRRKGRTAAHPSKPMSMICRPILENTDLDKFATIWNIAGRSSSE